VVRVARREIFKTCLDHKITFSISILVTLTVFFLVLIDIMPPTSLVIPMFGRYLITTMVSAGAVGEGGEEEGAIFETPRPSVSCCSVNDGERSDCEFSLPKRCRPPNVALDQIGLPDMSPQVAVHEAS
jgi:hypothetical protein